MMVEKTSHNQVSSFLEKQQVKNASTVSNTVEHNHMKKKENPAYILEITGKYEIEPEAKSAHRQDFLVKDGSDDALEFFYKKYVENMEKQHLTATDELIEFDSRMPLMSGEWAVAKMFHASRELVGSDLEPNQKNEALAMWDKYVNAAENIAKGGKDTFLEYNLMFAGIAANANDRMTQKWLDHFKESGNYTQERYDNVKQYATELQDKSGVFVSAEFQKDDASGNDIKYSYMGALCSIGVDELEFMAKHREAEDVWVNVAKGAYQNEGEMFQALRDKGYGNVVDEYVGRFSATEETLSQIDFKREDGALWDTTVGYQYNMPPNKQAFKDLKNKYFGKEDVHVTYTSEQLRNAYEQGEKEAKTLNDHPFFNLQTEGEKKGGTDNSHRIENLKKQIKELNKQIQEIKDMALPEERKNEMIKSFEQQIQTIQTQINDALESMAKQAKGNNK